MHLRTTVEELVLDWNGTVVADIERARRATNVVLAENDVATLSLQSFRTAFSLPLSLFFATIGIPADARDMVERRWNELLRLDHGAPLAPGATELLHACDRLGVPVGVITGADAAVVSVDAARLRIDKFIRWVMGALSDKRSALVSVREHSHRRIAYVGDTEHDIDHARAAGVLAVAYTEGYRPAHRLLAARPDVAISDLRDIIPLLRRPGSAPSDDLTATTRGAWSLSTAMPPDPCRTSTGGPR